MATETRLGELNEGIASVTADSAALHTQEQRVGLAMHLCRARAFVAASLATGVADGASHLFLRLLRTHAVHADESSGNLQAALERTSQGEAVRLTMVAGSLQQRWRLQKAHLWTKKSHLQ